MEDDLRRLMVEFCERFKLKYYVKYSHSLTQEEINASNLLGSGELTELLKKHGNDYSKIDKKVRDAFKRLGGTGIIEKKDAESLEKDMKEAYRDSKIIDYLKHNEQLSMLLRSRMNKIINEHLEDTLPIPKSKGFRSFYYGITGQTLTMMIHESIHYVLIKNGINFSDISGSISDLDEGFCVFMHFRFNKHIGFYKTGKDELTTDYRRWAGFFENLLKNVPDNEIISIIKKYSITDLQKLMERSEKIAKFRELQDNFLRDLIALNNTCDSIKHDINETFNVKNTYF